MLGAIIGDVCGSVYEWNNMKTARPYDIPLNSPKCCFTDDTVLIVAVAEACLGERDYTKALKTWGRKYNDVGYGTMFLKWLYATDSAPYGSFGNGSAMRVAPIGWLFDTLEETLAEAKRSADVTHDHPEGIKGAQATAAAIFWARTGESKKTIRRKIKQRFGYNLDRSVSVIRPDYSFDATCQGSVPEAIIAFLDSHDFEHALRLAISLGGDSDTIACITGSIAEAFYMEIPNALQEFAESKLTQEMRLVVEQFSAQRISPVRPNASDYGYVGGIGGSNENYWDESSRLDSDGMAPATQYFECPFYINDFGSLPAAIARARGGVANENPSDVDNAVFLEHSGIVFLSEGDPEKGLNCFLDAQKIWCSLAKSNPDIHEIDLSASLNTVSNFYGYLGDLENRNANWGGMIAVQRKMLHDGFDINGGLAEALDQFGMMLKEVGKIADSADAHREALDLYKELQQIDPDSSAAAAVACIMNTLGNRHKEMGGDPDTSLHYLMQAIEMMRPEAEKHPSENGVHLMGFLRNLASYYINKGEMECAAAIFQEAVDLSRNWASIYKSRQLNELLFGNLTHYGHFLHERRMYREALEICQEVVAGYRNLSRRFPNTEYGGDLAVALLNRGIALDNSGDGRGAIECMKEAVSIYRRLDFSDFAMSHLNALFFLCETALRHNEQDAARQAYASAKDMEQECLRIFGQDYEPFVERDFNRLPGMNELVENSSD